MVYSKLEAMAIYVVRSANANDIMASVYLDSKEHLLITPYLDTILKALCSAT
jgi:hypothetical protein